MAKSRLLLALLSAASLVYCLPITSSPLESNPDHLAWDELLSVETKNIEYEEVRKIPKSIFITPNFNETKVICRPGFKLHQDGKCYRINNFNIDPLDILKTQIESLFSVDKDKQPGSSDYEEYDYDNYDSIDTNNSYQVPLTLNFRDEEVINVNNQTKIESSNDKLFRVNSSTELVNQTNAVKKTTFHQPTNSTFRNSTENSNATESSNYSFNVGAANSTLSSYFQSFNEDILKSDEEFAEFNSDVNLPITIHTLKLKTNNVLSTEYITELVSGNDTDAKKINNSQNSSQMHVKNDRLLILSDNNPNFELRNNKENSTKSNSNQIFEDELHSESLFEYNVDKINDTVTMASETTEIYPMPDEQNIVIQNLKLELSKNVNQSMPKNLTDENDGSSKLVDVNDVLVSHLPELITRTKFMPKIQLKLSSKTNKSKEELPSFGQDSDKKEFESMLKQERNENTFNIIDENNRFVYNQLEAVVNNTMYYPIETTTSIFENSAPILRNRKVTNQIKVFGQNDNDKDVRLDKTSVSYKLLSKTSKLKPANDTLKNPITNRNKLIIEQIPKNPIEPNRDKSLINLSLFNPSYRNVNTKPVLMRFWNKMPLIRDVSIKHPADPARENSKSPKETLFKEIPIIDAYRLLDTKTHNSS